MGERDDLDVKPADQASRPDGSEGPLGSTVADPAVAPPVAKALKDGGRRDKIVGLGIVAVTFAVSMLISLWAKHNSAPPQSREPAPPTTAGLIGFPEKIEPIAVLPQARDLTERPLFRGFVAKGVGPSGLVDVSDKGSGVRYSFQSEPGQGAQPQRPPGTLPSRTFCGRQSVNVKHDGLSAEPDEPGFPCSSVRPAALPPPRCELSAIWRLAKKKGAPTKRRATIEYYQAQKGPAYRFSIPGTKHRFVVGKDCKREIKGKKALGSVP